MIDLHSHTNESDGTCTPEELVNLAVETGLDALGITDHDTFAGYEQALPLARERGLDLVCGIELSTRAPFGRGQRTVHMLAYFLNGEPSESFRAWVASLLASRRERNIRLIRSWQIDLKLNRIASCVLLSGEPHFLKAVWTDFVRSPFFTQTDLAYPPFELTDWLQTQLPYPRYGRLRVLASFQHETGYYAGAWNRISYAHLFDRIPLLAMSCLAIALGGVALVAARREPIVQAGASYTASMIVLGILVSLANCLTTFFGARFYLPVYSLFQMAMLLAASLAGNILLERRRRERLESFKDSR